VDDCTHECPAIEVDSSLGGLRVGRVLDRVVAERGLPEAIVLDNGPEFLTQRPFRVLCRPTRNLRNLSSEVAVHAGSTAHGIPPLA
jgi:hypothetical protein